MLKESQIVGSVGGKTYMSYFKSVQSIATIILVAVLFITSQVAMSGIDYFITRWWVQQQKKMRRSVEGMKIMCN